MARRRILWIEDSAFYENMILATPVHLSGQFDLTIAATATDAMAALRRQSYDAVVVDIRIPPGDDPRWVEIYYETFHAREAPRLGLYLLRMLLESPNADRWPDDYPPSAHDSSRYGVLSVESEQELDHDLARLGVTVYRDKGGGAEPDILLQTVQQILAQRPKAES